MKCGVPEMVYVHLRTDKHLCEISYLRLVVTILVMLSGERFISSIHLNATLYSEAVLRVK